MLLRSSSTPILGSLLPSDTPNRHFETISNNSNHNNKHHASNSDHHHNKISFHHGGGHSHFSSFPYNSCPSLVDQETRNLGGFRRAHSDGNLQGMLGANDMDEFHSSKHLPRKPHHSMLESIPSFSMYSLKYSENEDEDEEEDEDEQEWVGELSDLKRSITIGDIINGAGSGDFSFGQHMALIQKEQSRVLNELQSFSGDDEEGLPKSPPMYLATGLGLGVGFGGGEAGNGASFGLLEYGEGDQNGSDIEEHYKKMVEQNPGNSLFLRNYAQFLYQVSSLLFMI